jgi:dienelactone hydrolase
MRLLTAAALACWLLGAALDSHRVEPAYVRHELRIPMPHAFGTLAMTVVRPAGPGRFGAVILNHGVAENAAGRAAESPELLLDTAAAFVERRYAVFLPLRRGFGATGGTYAEDAGSCGDPRFRQAERESAADILAAYDYARRAPYVDPRRIILAGQSAGGVAALRAAADSPPGLVAVLAFAAGRGGDPLHSPGVPCAAERLGEVFQELGGAVRVPVLLHYARNDRYFGPEASGGWFARFKAGGGRAEYVLLPAFQSDGHFVFSSAAGASLWLPNVERFLQHLGIPFEKPQHRTI